MDDTDRDVEDAGGERGDEAGAEDDVGTAREPGALGYAIVLVGEDRSLDDDPAGNAVVEAVADAGSEVVTRERLEPTYDGVQSATVALVDRRDVDAVVTLGGTGVGPADVTVDAVGDLLDKHLPGFGELFRLLSRDSEGTAVVRTRATAGIVEGVPVFCLPGDPAAARHGVEAIVVGEAPLLVAETAGETADPS